MRLLWIVVMLGCGRVGFDPLDRFDPALVGDARVDGVSAGGDGDTCATARVISIGETLANQSIAGAADDLGNACGNGSEVVYAFAQPAMVMRTIQIDATFSGAARHANTCETASGTCADFSPTTPLYNESNFPPGTVYIVVDKTGGTGTTFTISVQ